MPRQKMTVLPGGAGTPLQESVHDYLTAVQARTRNLRTVEFYDHGLNKLLVPWARGQGINEVAGLDQRAVDRYADDLNSRTKADGKPLSAASVASYLRSVRQFLRWAADGKPTVSIARPRVPKRDLRDQVLSEAEMRALVDAAPPCATASSWSC